MRDKKGRFSKVDKLEIQVPSLFLLFKYSIVFLVLLPWIYILAFRFEILKTVEDLMEYLFSLPKEGENRKTPY